MLVSTETICLGATSGASGFSVIFPSSVLSEQRANENVIALAGSSCEHLHL